MSNILIGLLFLFSIFNLYNCQCGVIEENIDYRGVPSNIDINFRSVASVAQCCSLCNAEPRCNAWTFVTATSICWLKTSTGLKISTTGRISGTKTAVFTAAPITASPATTCSLEASFVYTGNDINMLQNVLNPSDCCNSCGRTAGCVAWSYLNDYRYCYLKSALPTPDRRLSYTNSYSGVVIRPASTSSPLLTTASPILSGSFCNIENGAVYLNNDIGGLVLNSSSDCCDTCGRTSGCVAWSFLNGSRYCYLKNALPNPANRVTLENTVSGTLIQRG